MVHIFIRGKLKSFAFIAFIFTCVTYSLLSFSHTLKRIVSSHSYDLAYDHIFNAQFQVYILTHDCDRFTADIAATFDSVILVPDLRNDRKCAALGQEQLHVEVGDYELMDDYYREKYARVLEHCMQGKKMKCLILEDDVVFIHDAVRTREVLVENTLSMFNHEIDAFDCTKRGSGWIKSTHTGNGSQCRVFSKPYLPCLTQCLREDEFALQVQLDYGLKQCQWMCGLVQKRFLLAVHAGLGSTMRREDWRRGPDAADPGADVPFIHLDPARIVPQSGE